MCIRDSNQEGIVKTSGLERITGRLNVDFQATDKLKFGANIMFKMCIRDSEYSIRGKVEPKENNKVQMLLYQAVLEIGRAHV